MNSGLLQSGVNRPSLYCTTKYALIYRKVVLFKSCLNFFYGYVTVKKLQQKVGHRCADAWGQLSDVSDFNTMLLTIFAMSNILQDHAKRVKKNVVLHHAYNCVSTHVATWLASIHNFKGLSKRQFLLIRKVWYFQLVFDKNTTQTLLMWTNIMPVFIKVSNILILWQMYPCIKCIHYKGI